MKSKCEDCCFCVNGDGRQSGCSANKLDVAKNRFEYSIKDGYYVFDGLCPYIRSKTWGEKNSGKNLVEIVHNETKIEPAIFLPIQDIESIDRFLDNFKNEIANAKYVNIINYSQTPIGEDIKSKFTKGKLIVTSPVLKLNPDLMIYQNIKLNNKHKYHQILVIDDPSKQPKIDKLLDKIQHKINNSMDYIVGVLGEGYYFLSKNLYCQLVANEESPIKFLMDNIDNKMIFEEHEL